MRLKILTRQILTKWSCLTYSRTQVRLGFKNACSKLTERTGFSRNNGSMHASPNLVVRLRRSLIVFLMLLFCGSAGASENPQPAINAGDNAWMLISTALVLMFLASDEGMFGSVIA